jgi:hypothetical protein
VDVFWSESFDALDPQRWREQVLLGHTRYEAVVEDGRPCLRAHSRHAASILLHPVRFNPDKFEWLSWSWRVDRFVDGENLRVQAGSDVPARVYVYFNTLGLPWQKRSIDYVWSSHLPVGTLLSSAFSHEAKIIVAESGTAAAGQWRDVRRNLEDDYERCFRGAPPAVVAIGLMTDTDSSGGEALAYFDDLRVSRQAPADPAPAATP